MNGELLGTKPSSSRVKELDVRKCRDRTSHVAQPHDDRVFGVRRAAAV